MDQLIIILLVAFITQSILSPVAVIVVARIYADYKLKQMDRLGMVN